MRKVSTKEFIWYLVCGAIAMFGIILTVFGIIGNNMGDIAYSQNFIREYEEANNLDLRFIGLIFIACGVLVSIFVLLYNAKRAERDAEKKIRREQRLAAQNNQTFEVKEAVQVVEKE